MNRLGADFLESGAGFTGVGTKLIIDNSIPLNPAAVAQYLNSLSYDARSVNEIFGSDPGDDRPMLCLAEWLDARVVASDRGHDRGGGFWNRAIRILGSVTRMDTIVRLIEAAI